MQLQLPSTQHIKVHLNGRWILAIEFPARAMGRAGAHSNFITAWVGFPCKTWQRKKSPYFQVWLLLFFRLQGWYQDKAMVGKGCMLLKYWVALAHSEESTSN